MTIEEFLNSMENTKTLINSKETWSRIGNKDSFEELGFSSEDEKEKFLTEWIDNNPYANI